METARGENRDLHGLLLVAGQAGEADLEGVSDAEVHAQRGQSPSFDSLRSITSTDTPKYLLSGLQRNDR